MLTEIRPTKEEQAIGERTAQNGYLAAEIRNESHIYDIEMEEI